MPVSDHLNHKPNPAGIVAIENIRRSIIALEETLDLTVPAGREKSLALTKLEECRMWAVKGAVINNSLGTDPLPKVVDTPPPPQAAS